MSAVEEIMAAIPVDQLAQRVGADPDEVGSVLGGCEPEQAVVRVWWD